MSNKSFKKLIHSPIPGSAFETSCLATLNFSTNIHFEFDLSTGISILVFLVY